VSTCGTSTSLHTPIPTQANEPVPLQVNVLTFARALIPLVNDDRAAVEELGQIVQDEYAQMAGDALGEMRRRKLGLATWADAQQQTLWAPLTKLMANSVRVVAR